MIKGVLIGFCIFLPQFQDDKKSDCQKEKNDKTGEKVVFRVPNFYKVAGVGYDDPSIALSLVPDGIEFVCLVQYLDEYGAPLNNPEEITKDAFGSLARRILSYGVLDSPSLKFFSLNRGYVQFVELLLKQKILTRDSALKVAAQYYNKKWVESAYFFEEALPGIFYSWDWSNFPGQDSSYFFGALVKIKTKEDPNQICEWLSKNPSPENFFSTSAKAYSELIRKGAKISEVIQAKLLSAYLQYSADLLRVGLQKTYANLGLTLPEPKIIRSFLCGALMKFERPDLEIVEEFQFFGLDFPKEYAALYRDAYLKNGKSLASVDYLSKAAGEEARPELWERYGNISFSNYRAKDFRKTHKDPEDYYHAAVEAYRRAIDKGVVISESRLNALIEEEKDLFPHTRDILTAYKLAGLNPKAEWIAAKLDKRIERMKDIAAGIFYDETGKMVWQLDDYDRKIIPFQEEIELAAYLNDPERNRKLCGAIAERASSQLAKEGPVIFRLYESCPLILYLMMRRSDTPAYLELEAVIDIFESLKFKDGLWCLAQHLFDSVFDLPARRAFHLSGLGKTAEDQYYGKKEERYWLKKRSHFNFAVRRQAVLNWQKEKK